ncbi:MAG: hypothetical protein GX651_02015 [Methanomicrobiales archaeon]|nr:hypothetical protein [Methanomicrobiales archaeon]
MFPVDLIRRSPVDITKLIRARDVPALIRLFDNPDATIRKQACDALSSPDLDAVLPVVSALASPSAPTRLGAIEVLAVICDGRSARPLERHLLREKYIELRYAAVLALGRIGSPGSIPVLLPLLRDSDKYIRNGAATALADLGWEPPTEPDRLAYQIAEPDWGAVRFAGTAAIGPLRAVFHDTDPATRADIASLLGEIGSGEGGAACETGLMDRDPHVRWAAVLSAMDCGIHPCRLPPFVAARERTGPNPVAAALLNFLFLGLGYNYVGKWWGFPVFMTYMSVIVLAQIALGPFLPFLFAYPVTAVFGVHAYSLARRIADS